MYFDQPSVKVKIIRASGNFSKNFLQSKSRALKTDFSVRDEYKDKVFGKDQDNLTKPNISSIFKKDNSQSTQFKNALDSSQMQLDLSKIVKAQAVNN
jgi:hypothetical protein